MSNPFTFNLDTKGLAFCHEIADDLVTFFKIPRDEAIGRINRHWHGQSINRPDNVVYHEDSDFWAKTIYYGGNADWWNGTAHLRALPSP